MTTAITTAAELLALLETLGNTADAVAENLRVQGIKGLPKRSERCPIANWIRREAQGVPAIEVDVGTICLVDLDGTDLLICPTPAPVEEFIEDFDRRFYADLIEDGG